MKLLLSKLPPSQVSYLRHDWILTADISFYINPPGVNSEIACAWGTLANPYGNWAPYVAGANTNSDGRTFVKLGWNPVYLEPATPFRNTAPNFGVEIECEGDNCEGLPCKIDPSTNGVNELTGETTTDGAGGGSFCVVTVPKGEKAHIVVFEKDGSSDDDDTSSTTVPIPTSTVASSSTSSSTSSTASPTTEQTASVTPFLSLDVGISIGMSTSVRYASASPSYTYEPHVFVESGTAALDAPATSAVQTSTSSPSTTQDSDHNSNQKSDQSSDQDTSDQNSDSGATTTTISMLAAILTACAAVLNL